MPTKGIKRKIPDWEESELDGHLSFQTDSYVFFRQSLLNMSLEKFNKGRTMMEPSLRRYVLIANTLRIIQEEIHLENRCNVPYVEGSMSGACDPLAGQAVGSVLPQDTENIASPMEDDFALTTAIASILKELENVLDDSCPQNNQKNQQPLGSQDSEIKQKSSNNTGPGLLSQPSCNQGAIVKEELFNSNPDSLQDIELINELILAASLSETSESMDTSLVEQVPSVVSLASGVSDVSVNMEDTTSSVALSSQALSVQNAPLVFSEEPNAPEAAFANFDIMNSGYLNDLFFDDPFSDIDTSVFEREAPAPSSRSSFSEDLWLPSSCSFPSYTSGQGLREPNDLDNIKEILVGS
ncbi:cell division cycle-associated protein 4-like [Ranitomeya imitator]|uniref:cell division cycle-associated protein 4-like n=1 Tax=Ranitomeya imitator TaxID=111125 RepID=UPI0037E86B26